MAAKIVMLPFMTEMALERNKLKVFSSKHKMRATNCPPAKRHSRVFR